MHSQSSDKAVSLVTKRGNPYLEQPPSVFYTKTELRKIHWHLYSPSSDKLYALNKRADGDIVNTDAKHTLDHLRKTCDTCQRHGGKP